MGTTFFLVTIAGCVTQSSKDSVFVQMQQGGLAHRRVTPCSTLSMGCQQRATQTGPFALGGLLAGAVAPSYSDLLPMQAETVARQIQKTCQSSTTWLRPTSAKVEGGLGLGPPCPWIGAISPRLRAEPAGRNMSGRGWCQRTVMAPDYLIAHEDSWFATSPARKNQEVWQLPHCQLEGH